MKKLVCIILSICLVFSLSIFSFAETHNINSIENAVEGLITSAVREGRIPFGNYTISNSIPTYYAHNNTLEPFYSVEHHVVFCNDNPVAIFTISGVGTTNQTYSLSEDFVKKLNELVLVNDYPYTLIVSENKVFAYANNDTFELAKYDTTYFDVDIVPENSPDVSSSAVPNNFQSSQAYEPNEYTTSEITNLIFNSYVNINTVNNEKTHIFDIYPSRAVVTIPGVPSYTQPQGSNYCWAASAWCVGETLNPTPNYSVEDCVAAAGGSFGSGGSANMQKTILGLYGFNDPVLYNALSTSTMEGLIDDGEPFIMLCFKNKNTNSLGHSVTCYRYDDSYSPTRFGVMDSLGSSSPWRWMSNSSNGTDYQITCGATTYIYVYALTPNRL